MKPEVSDEIMPLVKGYVSRRIIDVVYMKKLLDEEDFITVLSLAHRIKGNAGGHGLDQLGFMAKELEQDIHNGEYLRANHTLDQMEAYLNECKGHFLQ